MPSAPQKRDWAKGRSLEMQSIVVPSNWAASLLNCRTDWSQVPVSILGNMLRTNFCPLKSERDTVERSFFTKLNPGACEPGSGSCPMVFIAFPFKVTVAMISYFVQGPKILKKNGLMGPVGALLIKVRNNSKWGGPQGPGPSIGDVLSVCQLLDLDFKSCKNKGHDRTEPIEDGVNEVFPDSHSEYPAVIGPAGVPGHQDRGHCPGILQGPAEVLRGEIAVLVRLGEHFPWDHYGQILVGGSDAQRKAASHGTGKEAEGGFGHFQKGLRNPFQGPDAVHDPPEDHGADDQPDRAQHSGHSPG